MRLNMDVNTASPTLLSHFIHLGCLYKEAEEVLLMEVSDLEDSTATTNLFHLTQRTPREITLKHHHYPYHNAAHYRLCSRSGRGRFSRARRVQQQQQQQQNSSQRPQCSPDLPLRMSL